VSNPRSPAPPPPHELSAAAAHYAKLLADFVKDTGNAEWIATADALRVLNLRNVVDTAQRAWDEQWGHYERNLVEVCRRAGIPDAEIARARGVLRQNFHRRHGRRSEG
jgi:hypothetical protein